MRHRIGSNRSLSIVAATIFQFAASVSAIAGERTQYPLTIENCGVKITFEKAPHRVVSIGQASTEILLSLGLAEKIAGSAVWFGPVLKGYEKENAKIRRLADNDPSFEAVVGQDPDLVTAQFEWHVGPNGSVGTRTQFAELKIPTYVSPADCVAKDNSGGGDGVRKELFSMELIYKEIRDLGQIFDVGDRGELLIANLKKREAAAIRAVARVKSRNLPIVFWFSSKEIDGDAFVAGKNGPPAYIMQVLSAKNIIATEEEWPLVSWETISGANPAVIVVAEMDRRRYPADDPAAKLKFLETDPVTSKLEAVRKARIVRMDSQSMSATIRVIDGIETLAKAVESFGLAE